MTGMNSSWIFRRSLVLLSFVLVMGLVVGGCSQKPAVEVDPEAGMGTEEIAEQVPTPVVPEVVETPVVETPDYASMDPSEYGVTDVFFAFDEYELNNQAMALLAGNARALKTAGVPILISGHCDERGTVEYNLALGEKRAIVVRDYLISLGVSGRNLRITSYGESKPFDRGHDEGAWNMNRRAHFERP
jgi:peptidoglycan-associated lipoprotein